MPVILVRHPEGSLDHGRKATLAQKLTDVLLTMEGGARTAGGVAFASVLFAEVKNGDWWVGGHTDGKYVVPPGKFLVYVTIPEGYMNGAQKSEVHAQVNDAIVSVAGDNGERGSGASVLVIIYEVTEGNWGSGGRTLSMASIADAVGLSKSGERFKWVRAYFAAKARHFAASGYPADVGGLLPPG